jgi:hypothetical protein
MKVKYFTAGQFYCGECWQPLAQKGRPDRRTNSVTMYCGSYYRCSQHRVLIKVSVTMQAAYGSPDADT